MSRFIFNTGFYYPCIYNKPPSTILKTQRSIFAYVSTDHTQDPLYTTASQTAFINFCVAQNITAIYLDMYNYLGSSNYSISHQTTVQTFISAATANNISVWAYGGATNWTLASTQSFINTAIIANINTYNAASTASQKFSGFILDVEYWTDNTQTSASGLSGLIGLINNMRSSMSIPIACYLPFYFMNDDADWPMLSYNGKTKYPGAHLMDNADSVTVACYRNTALDNPGIGQSGQITLFQPFYNYAMANNIKNVYLTSETTNISPSYSTYYGLGKTYMESQYTLELAAFPKRNVMAGISIDSYDGWRAMGT